MRVIILVHDYTHLYGTWIERDIYALGKGYVWGCMHKVQLQSRYYDRLQIYVKEVAKGQKFSEEKKT